MTRRSPFRWALPAVCLALLCAAGCRTEPVSWRTSLHDVILFGDSLGWSELVPDTRKEAAGTGGFAFGTAAAATTTTTTGPAAPTGGGATFSFGAAAGAPVPSVVKFVFPRQVPL